MAKPIGQVGSGKQEEISLGPAPVAEAAQPAAAVSQAVAVPTFRKIGAVRTNLYKLLDRLIADFKPRSQERTLLTKEKNEIWPVESTKGVKRRTLSTRGVEVVRQMNARIVSIEQIFNDRVAPLHAELRSFLDNPSALLGNDGKVYVLNQDAYVDMLGNPDISTDAGKVVAFLRKQQGAIQRQKPKTAFEKETLRIIKLAIDQVNTRSVSTPSV